MARLKRDANFTFMLSGLLLTLVAGPVLLELGVEQYGLTIQAIFTITLIVSVWTAIEARGWFLAGIALVIVNGTATLINILFPASEPFSGSVALTGILAFCIFSIAFTVSNLFQSGAYEISVNRLVGAVSVYLLLGLAFGVLNMLVELHLPGSFKGLTVDADGPRGIDLIYFSFVTMTTLGYGDVTPIRPLAQAVAYIGAVIGQFYIAILVAGLVGAYISQQVTRGGAR